MPVLKIVIMHIKCNYLCELQFKCKEINDFYTKEAIFV